MHLFKPKPKSQRRPKWRNNKINTIVMVLMITMAMHYGGVMALFSGCATVVTSMPACASFIANPTPTASANCCTECKNVVQSQPQCLCQVFNSTASFMGLSQLPNVCNVDAPSECNASPSDSPPSGTTPPSNSPPSGTTPSPGTNTTSPPAGSPPPSDAALVMIITKGDHTH